MVSLTVLGLFKVDNTQNTNKSRVYSVYARLCVCVGGGGGGYIYASPLSHSRVYRYKNKSTAISATTTLVRVL